MQNPGRFRAQERGRVWTFLACAAILAASTAAQAQPYYGSPTPCPQTVSQVIFTYPDWVYGPGSPGPGWAGTTRGRGGIGILDQSNNVRTLNAREGAEGLGVSTIFDINYAAPGDSPGSQFSRKILRLTQSGTTIDFGNVLYDMQGVEGGWEMNVAVRRIGSEIFFSYPGWAVSEASPGPIWLNEPTGKGGIGKIDFFGYVSSVLPDMGNVEGLAFDEAGNLYFAVPIPAPKLTRKVYKLHADGYLLDLGNVIENMGGVQGGWNMKLAVGPSGEVYFNYPKWAFSAGSPGPSWLSSPDGSGGIGVISPTGAVSAFLPATNGVEGIAVNDSGVVYFARSADGSEGDRSIWKRTPESSSATKLKDVVTGMAGVRYGWSMDIAVVQCNAGFPTMTPQPTFVASPTISKTPSVTPTPSRTPSPTPYVDPCDARAGEVSFTLNSSGPEYGGFSRYRLSNSQITNVAFAAPMMGLTFDRSGDNYFVTNAGMPELMSLKFDGSLNYLGILWGSNGVKPGWTVSLAASPDNTIHFSRSIYADGGPGIGKWVNGAAVNVLSGVAVECMDFDAAGNLYFITDKLEADLIKLAPDGQMTTIARLWSAGTSADWWRPSIAVAPDGLVYFTASPFQLSEAGQPNPGGVFKCNSPDQSGSIEVADVPYAIALDLDLSGTLYIGHGQNDRLDLSLLNAQGQLIPSGQLYSVPAKQTNWAPDIAVFSCGVYQTPVPTLTPTPSLTPSISPSQTQPPTASPTASLPPSATPSYAPTLTESPTPPPTATPGLCSPGPQGQLLRGYRVEFLGSAYSADSNLTAFTYRLTGQGEPPEISHWVLELGACEVDSADPSPYNIGKDPTTGLTGIKWEQKVGLDESREFTLYVAGNVPTGKVEVAVKGGNGFESGEIAGPRCDCPGGGQNDPSIGVSAIGESFEGGADMAGQWQGGAMIIEDGKVHTLSGSEAMPSATIQLSGLCLSVPGPGDNIAAWWSEDALIPLTDKTVYRAQINVSTDQANPGAIPMFEMIYDNFNSATGSGPSYGGTAWLLDAAGGANGIGRPGGRETFEVFFTPNAALAPQWRGLLGDGGAFTPEADAQNDMRIVLRVLDMGSGGINAAFDQGTICVSSIRIDAFPIDSLPSVGVIYNPPISEKRVAAYALGQNPAYASIDEMSHNATYKLDSYLDRATLLPADTFSPPDDSYDMYELYPIPWQADALYRVTARIQAAEPWGGDDPLDAIFVNMDSATSEIGQMNFTTRGSADFMPRAASPRRPTVALGAQPYIAYFSGQNVSTIGDISYRRLRPTVDLFNSPTLNGVGSGRDPVQITGLKVEKIQKP